jgi:hypothetical protein
MRFSAHAPRAGFSYVLAECGLELRERIKRPEICGRIRTFSALAFRALTATRLTQASTCEWLRLRALHHRQATPRMTIETARMHHRGGWYLTQPKAQLTFARSTGRGFDSRRLDFGAPIPSMLQNRSPPRSYGALPLFARANRLLRPDQTYRRLRNLRPADHPGPRSRVADQRQTTRRHDNRDHQEAAARCELGPQYSQSVVYETSGIPHESGIPGVVTAADTLDCIGTTVA